MYVGVRVCAGESVSTLGRGCIGVCWGVYRNVYALARVYCRKGRFWSVFISL